MKPIYECLDYLLNHLYENRFKPEGQRIPFDIDNKVMPDLGLTTHEEFKGLLDMLIESKMVITIGSFSRHILRDYANDIMISPRGIDMKDCGGYTQHKINEASERNNLKAQAEATLLLTKVLAFAAIPVGILALVDLYWKYNWFHSCYWWTLSVIVLVPAALISYLVWKWLLQKKKLKV